MPQKRPRVAADLVPPANLDPYSLAKLERRLGIPRERLRAVGAHAGAYYKPFVKKEKERPFPRKFKATKKRIIDNPTGELKRIQREINGKILRPIVLPLYLCGGVKGRTVLDNVMLHLGAAVLVTMDIRNFFPSISNRQVYMVWSQILGFSAAIGRVLTRLTTFERHLPQGAPTSTLLANLVLYAVDGPIRTECARHKVQYSTWVDDLALSGPDARTVINVAVKALGEAGFRIPHRKMKIMGPGTRKVLNGVLLGRFPSALPERLAQVRSGIHKLRTNQVPPAELDGYIRSLEGRICHLGGLVPRKAKKLREGLEGAKKHSSVTLAGLRSLRESA